MLPHCCQQSHRVVQHAMESLFAGSVSRQQHRNVKQQLIFLCGLTIMAVNVNDCLKTPNVLFRGVQFQCEMLWKTL